MHDPASRRFGIRGAAERWHQISAPELPFSRLVGLILRADFVILPEDIGIFTILRVFRGFEDSSGDAA